MSWFLPLLAAACLAAPNPHAGFYQWAGDPPEPAADLLASARDRIKTSGAGLIRLYLGARFDYVHPVLSTRRFPELEERTPARILQLPRYRAVLEDDTLPTVVLTVYPAIDYGAGFDDINLLRPFGPREQEHEYAQMFDLAALLLRDYGKLAKTIVLANTEADDKLLEIMNYTGSPALALDNLRVWQNTRYRAVADARRRFPKARLRLLNAFELSLVNLSILRLGDRFLKHPQGCWNSLRDIVPHVRFDLLSYSSYESTNSPFESGLIDVPAAEVGRRLERDIRRLQAAVSTPVMIGELGIPRDRFEGLSTGGVDARLDSALAALERTRPAYVVFWQVFDAPPDGGPEPVQWGWLDPRRRSPTALLGFVRGYRPGSTGKSGLR